MRDQVEQFLDRWSTAVREKSATFIPTEKNRTTMLTLLMDKAELEEVLANLTPENYSQGPEPDEDPAKKGDVWVFGTELQNREVYIKVKLIEASGDETPVCLSFHFAEYGMQYPLRRS